MIGRRPLLWFLPLALMLGLFLLYPTVDIIRLSFANARLDTEQISYSLSNYRILLGGEQFYEMLFITLIFVIFSVAFQLFLGFSVARLIQAGEDRNLRGTLFVRTAVLTGWVIPGIIVGVVWNLLLTESKMGILNYWAEAVGIGHIAFLSDPSWALVSVIVANIWRGTAASMIMEYAGLKMLPRELHEAAVMDGAPFLKETLFVTLPAMKNIIFTNLVLISISTVNTFDSIIALTGGGPGRSTEVLALSVYRTVFQDFNLGKGAATAVVLLVVNLVMTFIYSRIIKGEQAGSAT
jgi:multiple sugar transport system permease protein